MNIKLILAALLALPMLQACDRKEPTSAAAPPPAVQSTQPTQSGAATDTTPMNTAPAPTPSPDASNPSGADAAGGQPDQPAR